MLKTYLTLLGAGLLLAGCNQTGRPAETPALAAASGSSAAAVVAAPTADSAAVPATDQDMTLRPEPAAAPPAAAAPVAASRLTAASADRLRPAPTAPPLAGATRPLPLPGGLVSAAEPADNVAGMAAAQAGTAELRAFLQTGLPAPRTFAVRPGRDTLLLGPQGTQVLLPADAFDLPADSATVVQLTLREFYTDADIVLAGLNTQSGPRLLETGGMVHLEATANGRPVQLRPGAFVHLRMPANGQSAKNMRVFAGVAHKPALLLGAASASNPAVAGSWQEPPLLQAGAMAGPPARRLRGRWLRGRRYRRGPHYEVPDSDAPQYKHSERAFRRDLAEAIDYSDALRARLRKGRRVPRAERLALAHAAETYHERVLRIVGGTLLLDSTGVLVKFEAGRSADARLLAAVQAGLRRLPRWQPARYPSYPAPQLSPLSADVLLRERPQRYRLPTVALPTTATPGPVARPATLYFTASGRVHAELKPWLLGGAVSRRKARSGQQLDKLLADSQHQADSLYATNPAHYDSLYQAHVRFRDSLNAVQRQRAVAELARLRTQFTDTSRAAVTQQGVYNELSSQGLSWINCDRYLGPGPLITYKVNASRVPSLRCCSKNTAA